jgi:fucose permease
VTNLLLAIIYLAFISLGLPDSLLGSSWPTMYQEFGVPVSFAGIASMIISAGTIISSLMSDRLTRKLGTGMVMVCSVAATAIALFGFSTSHAFWVLCLWAIPYGLGAGAVDASLNNYVALHYASRHMSWLHCMWGVGASLGPAIMGAALSAGRSWNTGYGIISVIQIALTIILFFSLPLWKKRPTGSQGTSKSRGTSESHGTAESQAVSQTEAQPPASKPLSLPQIFAIPGAKAVFVTFFCYCTVETTAGLWAGSYLVLHAGISKSVAATMAALFYAGIAVGRGISGFATLKFNDVQMTRGGEVLLVIGLVFFFLPNAALFAPIGLMLVGLGCAPIYPSIIHATPDNFGADRSQAVIGVQMATAYTGSFLMPPVFGLIANNISIALLPEFLAVATLAMILSHEALLRRANTANL